MSDLGGRSIVIFLALTLIVSVFAGCEDNSLPKKPILGRINPETRQSALEDKVAKAAVAVKTMREKNLELAEALKMKEGLLHNNNIFINELEMQIEDLLKYGGTSRRDTITLDDQFFFKPGVAELTDQGETYLLKIATELAKIDYLIRVEGHTDAVPVQNRVTKDKFTDNWGLSAGRAGEVIRFMESKGGIPGERLIGSFYGPYRPIADNSKQGNILNRRVEIRLIPPFYEKETARMGVAAPGGEIKDKMPDRNFRSTNSFLNGEKTETPVRTESVNVERPIKPEPEGVKFVPSADPNPPVKTEDNTPEEDTVEEDAVPVILK